MSVLNWYHFSPNSPGGSFGRYDMGTFCRVGNSLFVVPLFESSIMGTPLDEVEAKIAAIQDSETETVYELLNGEFISPTTNWPARLKQSMIAQPHG